MAAEKNEKPASPSGLPPFEINNILLKNGEIQVQDERFPASGNIIYIKKVNGQLNNFSFPFKDISSELKVSTAVEGKIISGSVAWSGNINLKTMAADAKIECQNLSAFQINGKEPAVKAEKITLAAVREKAPSERIVISEAVLVRPYFRVETDRKGNFLSYFPETKEKGRKGQERQNKGDADISKGILDLNMDISVRSELINAPGKAVIRNLEFKRKNGIGDKFLGVPRSLVLNLLKTSNNELPLEFTLVGKLNDPKFSITEGIVKRFTVSIAQKLGLSAIDVGEKVVVKEFENVKEIGKSLKSIGKGVEKLFRK